MVNCDRCGEKLKMNAKFCSACGDEITWPDINSFEENQEKSDKLVNYLKDKGNEILEDNLPEEYVIKVKDNISNLNEISQNPETLDNARENIHNASKTVQESGSNFINENDYLSNAKDGFLSVGESLKDSSSNFINDNVSNDTQEKIRSSFNNFSTSTKKFTSKTSIVFNNIHNHRSNVKEQKKVEKKLKYEAMAKKRDEEWVEKQKQKEINHQNAIIKIMETRTAKIEFPIIEKTDDAATGALKGEMMGSAAGRAMEGLFGDNNSLSTTLNAGLVMGGVGALIGGFAASADDGLRWENSQLYIADDELIISGKYSVPFDEIKLVNTTKLKNNDMLVLTLKDSGIEFRTEDASALKIVIDEYMQKYFSEKRKPSNVDELLKYGELYEKGVITKEELELKKKELL